jgi:hypothetical protein
MGSCISIERGFSVDKCVCCQWSNPPEDSDDEEKGEGKEEEKNDDTQYQSPVQASNMVYQTQKGTFVVMADHRIHNQQLQTDRIYSEDVEYSSILCYYRETHNDELDTNDNDNDNDTTDDEREQEDDRLRILSFKGHHHIFDANAAMSENACFKDIVEDGCYRVLKRIMCKVLDGHPFIPVRVWCAGGFTYLRCYACKDNVNHILFGTLIIGPSTLANIQSIEQQPQPLDSPTSPPLSPANDDNQPYKLHTLDKTLSRIDEAFPIDVMPREMKLEDAIKMTRNLNSEHPDNQE